MQNKCLGGLYRNLTLTCFEFPYYKNIVQIILLKDLKDFRDSSETITVTGGHNLQTTLDNVSQLKDFLKSDLSQTSCCTMH